MFERAGSSAGISTVDDHTQVFGDDSGTSAVVELVHKLYNQKPRNDDGRDFFILPLDMH